MVKADLPSLLIFGAAILAIGAAPSTVPVYKNPALPAEQRITNLLSLMTIDEKIDALSTNSGVPRLGVPSFGSSEGIHGVVQRGGGKRDLAPIPTTQFPQPPGMGASWDPALVRKAGVEGFEARYITQTPSYGREILIAHSHQPPISPPSSHLPAKASPAPHRCFASAGRA